MEPLITLDSRAAILPDADIDTDIIFPARFLLITAKAGLGRYAFYDKRQGGAAFPLGEQGGPAAGILLAGPNFGCGSSREQAVWALHDLGVRVIMAESFGEIFRSNCFKSGVLPIVVSAQDWSRLRDAAAGGKRLHVDLRACAIAASGEAPIGFTVEDWRREALLNGWDDLLILLNTRMDAIDAFEDLRRAEAPWLFEAAS